MKKISWIILLVIGVGLSNCSKEEVVSWETAYGFTIENIMGEEVNIVQDDDAYAIATNGFSSGGSAISGTQVAGCSSSYIKQENVGFEFHLKYEFSKEENNDSFTEAMFQTLWTVGESYKLGKEGDDLFDNPFIYIGLESEEGVLKKYVTEVNASDDNSHLEILSREYSGKTEKGRDVYEVKVKYESRLVNMDDESDVLYLKDGNATLKVPNFSQENTK